jgi:hypothetical protein
MPAPPAPARRHADAMPPLDAMLTPLIIAIILPMPHYAAAAARAMPFIFHYAMTPLRRWRCLSLIIYAILFCADAAIDAAILML